MCDRIIGTIIILLLLVHPNIVEKMIMYFNCKEVDSNWRQLLDMDKICFKWNHYLWVLTVSVPGLAIWGLGIPLFSTFILSYNRKNLESTQVLAKYGFLYTGYKTRFFFWESIIMYRKIGILVISVYLK